ncbi:unnamed protein product [Soboliphyme baturini]|uniref:Complex I subunit B13 n=1 Tax=Soboliphyme baturini TaxID=241478 RepID=A0A183IW42_9BILA|nr:unnamed protein product [Soboliphyme baturini]
MASKILKTTTGLTGLNVSRNPHHYLKIVYNRILRGIQEIPEEAAYRKSVERIVGERLRLVETEPDPIKLEEKIGMGQLEEVITQFDLSFLKSLFFADISLAKFQAEAELGLVRTMLKYKCWEPLVGKPQPDQWKWPV